MDRRGAKSLKEVAEEFNRFHAPEVCARILRIDGRRVVVEFDGRSCRSCGGQDYLEDFAYEAGDRMGVSMALVHFDRRGAYGFLGIYEVGGWPEPESI